MCGRIEWRRAAQGHATPQRTCLLPAQSQRSILAPSAWVQRSLHDSGPMAAHSRFVQRMRRRYAAELPLLPPGAPDAARGDGAGADACATAAARCPSALRVARQLCLERLAVPGRRAGGAAGHRHRRHDGAGRGHAGAGAGRRRWPTPTRATARRCDAQGRRIEFWIVGMGKLGARELNVSSDIDLIYVYDDDGETAGRRRRGRSPTTSTSRSVAKQLYTLIGDTTERRLRLPRRPGAAAQRQLRPAGVQPADAGGVPPGAGPRMGALRLAQEPRGRAARQRRPAAARWRCARWSRPSSSAATSTTACSTACASCTARSATRRSAAPPAGPSAPTTSSCRAAASARSSSSCSCCRWCAAASSPRCAPARR